MRPIPGQDRGEHDFDLITTDGLVYPVEVTAAVDPDITELHAFVLDFKKGGPRVLRVLCKSDWYIHPSADANINRIRSSIDAYLFEVEQEGLAAFWSRRHQHDSKAVARIRGHLKIQSGRASNWSEGYIRIALRPAAVGWTQLSPLKRLRRRRRTR